MYARKNRTKGTSDKGVSRARSPYACRHVFFSHESLAPMPGLYRFVETPICNSVQLLRRKPLPRQAFNIYFRYCAATIFLRRNGLPNFQMSRPEFSTSDIQCSTANATHFSKSSADSIVGHLQKYFLVDPRRFRNISVFINREVEKIQPIIWTIFDQ